MLPTRTTPASPVPPAQAVKPHPPKSRLDGWDEIAAHIGKTSRTAQRWTRLHGMPVHHATGSPGGKVYAFVPDLDDWLKRMPELHQASGLRPHQAVHLPPAAAVVIVAAAVAAGFWGGLPRPRVTFVSPLIFAQHQSFVIRGRNLGLLPGGMGIAPRYIELNDVTGGWHTSRSAPGPGVTWDIARWMNSEIDIAGFEGTYGTGNSALRPGDRIVISVWNPQTHLGPSHFSMEVQAHAAQPTLPFTPYGDTIVKRTSGEYPGHRAHPPQPVDQVLGRRDPPALLQQRH